MNIKGMDKNMQCRGFQFEIGKEYKIENNGRKLSLCSNTVFHYCKSLQQVHEHYTCYSETNRYFEIEVLGEEITDGKKCGSDHIKIIREITGEELNALKGLNNRNAGLFNLGYKNSGDMNSGDMNSGDWNIGDKNSGNGNTGYGNVGDGNVGDGNTGDSNSGDMNLGDMNLGCWNLGIANKCFHSNGVFCNEPDTNIKIFNKPSGMSLRDFYYSKYWSAMCSAPFNLTERIEYTEEEIKADQKKAMIGGYLKTYTYEEAWANWWDKLTEENKAIIQEIPNFDREIFKDITGIEI